MKVIVLGSNGFIGRNLTPTLKIGPCRQTFREVLQVTDIDAFLKAGEKRDSRYVIVDCVGVKPFFYKPINDLTYIKSKYINLFSRYSQLLEFATMTNSKFVFLSSGGAVYGSYRGSPWKEDDLLNPITIYGQVCKDIEKLVLNANGIVLRGSNIYGALKSNKQKQGIITELLLSFLNNTQIQIFNDGQSVRDYLHIADFVKALQTILLQIDGISSVYNISSGTGLSQLEVIEIIRYHLSPSDRTKLGSLLKIRSKSMDPIAINILSPEKYIRTFESIQSVQIIDGVQSLMKKLAIIK